MILVLLHKMKKLAPDPRRILPPSPWITHRQAHQEISLGAGARGLCRRAAPCGPPRTTSPSLRGPPLRRVVATRPLLAARQLLRLPTRMRQMATFLLLMMASMIPLILLFLPDLLWPHTLRQILLQLVIHLRQPLCVLAHVFNRASASQSSTRMSQSDTGCLQLRGNHRHLERH
jgi:hypothetical protein